MSFLLLLIYFEINLYEGLHVKLQQKARVSLQRALIKVSQVLQPIWGKYNSYMQFIEHGINRLETLLNSKEYDKFLGVMRNNIFNLFFEIFMQVINLLTILFYHICTWL